MNRQSKDTDTWAPCEAGQLQSLCERLRRQQSPSMAKVAAVTMAACAAVVLVVGLAMNGFGQSKVAPIACHEVGIHLADYASGDCESELTVRIQRHLDRCGKCAKHLEQIRTAAAEPSPRLALLASLWGGAPPDPSTAK